MHDCKNSEDWREGADTGSPNQHPAAVRDQALRL
jgi:hypothetical protein